MRILFSDKKFFDIDGVYNSQNDRGWAVNRANTDEKGGIKQRRKFSQSNGLVGYLFQGCNTLGNLG